MSLRPPALSLILGSSTLLVEPNRSCLLIVSSSLALIKFSSPVGKISALRALFNLPPNLSSECITRRSNSEEKKFKSVSAFNLTSSNVR